MPKNVPIDIGKFCCWSGKLLEKSGCRKNDYESAMFHFQQLLQNKPDYWVALARLVEVMRRTGTCKCAICMSRTGTRWCVFVEQVHGSAHGAEQVHGSENAQNRYMVVRMRRTGTW